MIGFVEVKSPIFPGAKDDVKGDRSTNARGALGMTYVSDLLVSQDRGLTQERCAVDKWPQAMLRHAS